MGFNSAFKGLITRTIPDDIYGHDCTDAYSISVLIHFYQVKWPIFNEFPEVYRRTENHVSITENYAGMEPGLISKRYDIDMRPIHMQHLCFRGCTS